MNLSRWLWQSLPRLFLTKNGFVPVRCVYVYCCCCWWCMHKRATPCLCATCFCVSVCVMGERDGEAQGLFSYATVERVSFAPCKSHFHFYFRRLHVHWRNRAACKFSDSLVDPVLQYYSLCFVRSCMPVHVQICVCAFLGVHSCSYLIRAGISILPSSLKACCAAATGGQWGQYWWMV